MHGEKTYNYFLFLMYIYTMFFLVLSRYHQYLFKSLKPYLGEHSLPKQCPLCPQVEMVDILSLNN